MNSNTQIQETALTAQANVENGGSVALLEAPEILQIPVVENTETLAPIAAHPNILELLVSNLQKMGVIGEARICKLLYLALTTRLSEDPVSIAVKGPSAGGKSFLVENVLKFFPGSSFIKRTAMSPKALFHSKEDFSHKFLYFAEADGISDSMEYILRSLLSEKSLKYETIIPDSKKRPQVCLLEKSGPTGVILTTTRTHMNSENETRYISVTVQDTREQTRAVCCQIARDENIEMDLTHWHDFQIEISNSSTQVFIPYAEKLAGLINIDSLRMKRDFKAFLSLIKAHALIHKNSRKYNSNGEIVADYEDYVQVKDIAGAYISESAENSVSSTIRETVKAVEMLITEKNRKNSFALDERQNHISIFDIAMQLGLDKSSTARRIKSSCEAGYLENIEHRLGRPAKVRLGIPLPEEQEIFPSVDKLKS